MELGFVKEKILRILVGTARIFSHLAHTLNKDLGNQVFYPTPVKHQKNKMKKFYTHLELY